MFYTFFALAGKNKIQKINTKFKTEDLFPQERYVWMKYEDKL